MSDPYLLGAVYGLIIAVVSYRLRFLTASGAAATFVLAVIIYAAGEWQWTAPILTFFLLSSLLSKVGKHRKGSFEHLFEKSDVRDAGQVLANGGVATILAAVSIAFPHYEFYPYYLGAIAAVTADTWGTELGLLARGSVTSIVTFRPVPPGTSGGVSNEGVLAGAAGAAVIALSGYAWYADLQTAFWIVIAGVGGSFVDSLAGALVQARYRCVACGRVTERRTHCGKGTEHIGGYRWVTNDVVNWICSLTGALVVWAATMM
jgi:uncharacterized protein (TIGR00297 family)